MSGLCDTLLNIGADHEGHRLMVLRNEDDDELGPGDWALVCVTEDESPPLLDFRELERERTAAVSSDTPDDGPVRVALSEIDIYEGNEQERPPLAVAQPAPLDPYLSDGSFIGDVPPDAPPAPLERGAAGGCD